MPDFQRYPNEGLPYFITSIIKDRQPLFTEAKCCQIVIDSISFIRNRLGHQVHAYVLMPDHLHLVVTPKEDSTISQAIHSFKLYTSRQIWALFGSKGGIWQARFYERALRTPKDADEALSYVHNNPVNAKLVECPEDYKWSSFRACVLGEPTPIEIDPLDW